MNSLFWQQKHSNQVTNKKKHILYVYKITRTSKTLLDIKWTYLLKGQVNLCARQIFCHLFSLVT